MLLKRKRSRGEDEGHPLASLDQPSPSPMGGKQHTEPLQLGKGCTSLLKMNGTGYKCPFLKLHVPGCPRSSGPWRRPSSTNKLTSCFWNKDTHTSTFSAFVPNGTKTFKHQGMHTYGSLSCCWLDAVIKLHPRDEDFLLNRMILKFNNFFNWIVLDFPC